MGLWLADAPLVLASRSSARRMLLTAAGVPVDAHPADIDERGLERGLESAAMAQSAGAPWRRSWRAKKPSRWRAVIVDV